MKRNYDIEMQLCEQEKVQLLLFYLIDKGSQNLIF